MPVQREKLKGKQPKLSEKQQKELCRMRDTGQYSISDLAELFTVSRATVYRTLSRGQKMTDLTTQQHLVKIVHDYACPSKGSWTVHQRFKWITSAFNTQITSALLNG